MYQDTRKLRFGYIIPGVRRRKVNVLRALWTQKECIVLTTHPLFCGIGPVVWLCFFFVIFVELQRGGEKGAVVHF